LWHDAWRALGPAGDTDLRDRADGSLWLIRDQYQAETAWAPKHVGRELGYVRASAEEARLGAVRAGAEAEAARKAGNDEVAARHEQQAEQSRRQESAYLAQEGILAGVMDDRRAWEAATEPQRRLAVAADAELRRRNPELRIEPLRSAEPAEVTDRQRADLDKTPGPDHEYEPPAWLRELAEARTAFSEKIAERQSLGNRTKTPTTPTSARRSRPGSATTGRRCSSRLGRRSRRLKGSPNVRPKPANVSCECHDDRGGCAGNAASSVDDPSAVVPGHRLALAR
jgi:hypothetical protein